MLVTAAFIGPGTVLVASRAGAMYGFSLLWAVAFSVFAAIVLQEMAARLGIVSGSGLAEAIKRSCSYTSLRWGLLGLVLIGILIGNAAFQTGNLLGAATGAAVLAQAKPSHEQPRQPIIGLANEAAEKLSAQGPARLDIRSTNFSRQELSPYLIVLSFIAWLLLMIGRFDWLQKVLTLLVVLMSGLFVLAALISAPRFSAIVGGLVPQFPVGSGLTIIALIGTTVVPYNLFLHASAAASRWPVESVKKTSDKERAVKNSRTDTWIAVLIGGAVTASILITAAMAFHVEGGGTSEKTVLPSVEVVAQQLQPALGAWAKTFFAIGLCAAGLTSAITAPLAAAYATAGCFGWPSRLSDWRLKSVATLVMGTGLGCAIYFGGSPQQAVLIAQAANGLLLPIIAVLLLVLMNRVDVMFRFHNTLWQNGLGVMVIGVVTLLAAQQLISVFEKILTPGS